MERLKTKDLLFYLKNLLKEQQIKFRENRKNKIIKVRL